MTTALRCRRQISGSTSARTSSENFSRSPPTLSSDERIGRPVAFDRRDQPEEGHRVEQVEWIGMEHLVDGPQCHLGDELAVPAA
jgi:hypothetical protein